MEQTTHTKRSAYSRKYSINTSAMMNNINNFTPIGEESGKMSYKDVFTRFSSDIGRCDFPYEWIAAWSYFVFPLLIILSSIGSELLLISNVSGTLKSVVSFVQYIIQISPETNQILKNVMINSVVLFGYLAYLIFFLYILREYQNDRFPSTFELKTWIFLSKCVVPLMTLFFASITFSGFNESKSITNMIVFFSFGIPISIMHLILTRNINVIWNASPLFRKKDKSQIWYCYSSLEIKYIYLLYINIAMERVLQLVSHDIAVKVFFGANLIVLGYFLVFIWKSLPYVLPSPNALFITVFIISIVISSGPLVFFHFSSIGLSFYVSVLIATPIIYYVSRFIVSSRVSNIIARFKSLHYLPDDENKEDNIFGLNLLNPPAEQVKVDYDDLGLTEPSSISLYMRIGFMFNVEDINNLRFVQWATNSFSQGEVVLPAIQIAYSIQIDMRYLNELQKLVPNISGRPSNLSSFISLFNELRQELLTQLNKPLLDAVSLAKKSNSLLQQIIGDFWGAVLKQKVDSMLTLLPQISTSMIHTEKLFQRLLRNYERTPVVLRETTLFYHKSLGDHKATVECQSNYNRSRKKEANGDDTQSENSAVSGGSQNVDKQFLSRLEPFMAAQDAIESIPSTPLSFLSIMMVFGLLIIMALSAVVFGIGLTDMMTFTQTFEPIRLFSNIAYSVTRLPQLARRYQLFENGFILPHNESVGPPLATNLEFITQDKIIPSMVEHIKILKNSALEMLTTCKNDPLISPYCSTSIYPRVSGSTTKNVTAYDLLSTFFNSADELTVLSSGQWSIASQNSNMKFLFENFDILYSAIRAIMDVTRFELVKKSEEFESQSYLLLAVIWGIPFVFILPFGIYTLYSLDKEIRFTLKLFFGLPKNEISTLRWSSKSKRSKKAKRTDAGRGSVQSDNSNTGLTEIQNQVNEQLTDSLATSERLHGSLFSDFALQMGGFCIVSCIFTSLGIYIYHKSMDTILNVASGFAQAVDTTSSVAASYVWMQELFTTEPILHNITYIQIQIEKYIDLLIQHYNDFLYVTQSGMSPGVLLGDGVIEKYVTSTSMSNNVDTQNEPVNGLLHSVYFSLSCESQINYLDSLTDFLCDPTHNNYSFNFSNIFVYHYEHLMFSHLQPLLMKGQDLLLDQTNSIELSQEVLLTMVFVLLFSVQIIYYFTVLLRQYLILKHHHETIRKLLLLLPPEALLKSQTIVKWLSGVISVDSTQHKGDLSNSTSKNMTFDFIVNSSKCGLILTDSNLVVTQTNSSVGAMLKVDTEAIKGRSIREILSEKLLDKDKAKLFKAFDHETGKMKTGRHLTNAFSFISTILGSGSQLSYISISIVGHSDENDSENEGKQAPANSFSFVIMDRTAEHFQEALVDSEKKKSEKLIASLLPPSIVKRMNEGETDITFQVQSATVLFTSVSGWNELIKDMKAVQVMSFLNRLFSLYDEELANFPAITKLKTIGHIYMICGGLFSDSSVNSSMVVVNYAIRLLQIAEEISTETQIPFQITVGVNTGGPINCGILGHTRPVFDIIGDAVNVASRMNSSCVPGYIQTSEGTFEAIKFLQYNIKERGEIQIKGKGLLKTYLVSHKTRIAASTSSKVGSG